MQNLAQLLTPRQQEQLLAEAVAALTREQAARRFERYRLDPARYAQDVLGIRWWSKQVEIAQSVVENRRTAVKAGHSVGKTHGIGGLVQWHYDCFDPSITLTTAPNWSSIHDLLWGEVRSQRPTSAAGRLLDLKIDGGPMHYAKGHNAESSAGFQGRHEGRQLIVIDEAMGTPPYIWEATNAMMTSPLCRTLVSGNPTQVSGEFYDLMNDPAWNVITISCLEHPNIAAELSGQPAPFPKAVSLTWVNEMLAAHTESVDAADRDADCFEFPPDSGQWWRPDDIFRSRVLGLFPKQAASSVWNEAWLEFARVHQQPLPERMPEIGADIARFGDDQTVLYGGSRPCVTVREAYSKQDTMETVGRIRKLCHSLADQFGVEWQRIPIKIDDTGLGGGCTDRLRELSYNVTPVVAGATARDPDAYYDTRSELWFVAAKMGKNMQLDLSRLPKEAYRKLSAELRGVLYKIQSEKTLRVESKSDTKKRTGHSPDDADAFNLWCLKDNAPPTGALQSANPQTASRFVQHEPAGGRWGRTARKGYR